ncbi:type IV toxin-antitoxin system AbiEi family antitoxin domain-containing protein [Nocardioides sp.]|uniref:type IV toxin-antitoxin system AbiEi family antitoxin domain-containing protein n=1 Tax=Nocardioides sp. TaxID=35761 RepID=UPI003D100926
MDERLRAIARIHGVFTRREALEQGYDDRSISVELQTGRWTRVRRGAYVFADSWRDLDERGRHRLVARAVLRNAKCEVALSHTSALMEFGTPHWDLDLSDVHLQRFDRKAGRREAGVVQHRGTVGVNDLTVRDGLLISSATRLALDLTMITDTEHALVAMDGLLQAGETTLELLSQALQMLTWWPHSLRTRLVLDLADGRSESAGETRLRYLCWCQGLPRPVPQFEVRDHGRVIARLDLALPELGVWLEFDGAIKYRSSWREGDQPEDVVLREKHREDLIRRLTGWRCIRVTWADLRNPAALAAKIRRAINEQARVGRQAS